MAALISDSRIGCLHFGKTFTACPPRTLSNEWTLRDRRYTVKWCRSVLPLISNRAASDITTFASFCTCRASYIEPIYVMDTRSSRQKWSQIDRSAWAHAITTTITFSENDRNRVHDHTALLISHPHDPQNYMKKRSLEYGSLGCKNII